MQSMINISALPQYHNQTSLLCSVPYAAASVFLLLSKYSIIKLLRYSKCKIGAISVIVYDILVLVINSYGLLISHRQ